MTNLQAALGLAQLERLDEVVVRKRAMGAAYSSVLSVFEALQCPLPSTVLQITSTGYMGLCCRTACV